ncbi:beta-lactamase [Sulfolobus acidocaldarius SUSAZ]|nr:beta-lactamase [Sulfolobus acidocaldarius SUSAZ]
MRIHKPYIIHEDKDHKFVWLGLDESDYEKGLLTNQYLIVDGDKGILLDPGGYFVFERVFKNLKDFVKPENIIGLFYSHQDPDVVGAMNLWLDTCPNAKVYISEIWERFLPHLGISDPSSAERIIKIPDKGMQFKIEKNEVRAIPAHFLHSEGNFHVYDVKSKVYFSGDIGAAVFPKGKWSLYVQNFDEHVKYMEWFHKRYLPTRKALDIWLKRVKELDIKIIAPQHGSIFEGDNVKKFINWLDKLDKVGIDLME